MPLFDYSQHIGKYRIDSLLGQGAMGVVYKAFDSEIAREVAIKILHLHLLTGEMGEELTRRFANEVKAAARCQHANIVTVYDYGIYQNQPYMVMEYVKGIDLQVFLKSGKTLPAEQAINLILKVLDALYNAHALGIVHRDIKPANIMLLENGHIKVTDFGVAHLENSDLTNIGDVMGTPSYMSPEARSGGIVTASSDLYATALVLLELLINKRVKASAIDHASLIEQLSTRELAPHFITNIANVLNKALQYHPHHRYTDALNFSKALNACLEQTTDYYQMTSELAATVIMINSNIQPADRVDNTLFNVAASSMLLQSQLTAIEKNLTHYLGPVAKVMIKKQAKNTSDINQLISSLSAQIPSIKERQNFINSLNFSNVTHSSNSILSVDTAFTADYIAQLTANLTQYVGPIAKHLIKATLKQVNNKEQLCNCLAAKIPNSQERDAFLKTCTY